jgi:hypothetical protein
MTDIVWMVYYFALQLPLRPLNFWAWGKAPGSKNEIYDQGVELIQRYKI